MINQTGEKVSAWHTFLKAHSVIIRALEHEMMKDQHLPLNWFDVLAWLNRAPGGRLRMQVLANSIYLSRSGLTRLLNRMAAAGLVERQNCPDDRRGWYAIITDKGRATYKCAFPQHTQQVEKQFLGRFNDDEIETLESLLSRLTRPVSETRRKTRVLR
jgi:DNA-binding MarR family transcriptional regulator